MNDSNLRCSCGEQLFSSDSVTKHRLYICTRCREVYAVKGQDHYMIIPEIDLKTGQIIPVEETEKGKAHFAREKARLEKLYGKQR